MLIMPDGDVVFPGGMTPTEDTAVLRTLAHEGDGARTESRGVDAWRKRCPAPGRRPWN
jgi:hypothetical protein